MRQIKIKQLYKEYCEYMAAIDDAREQLSETFKVLNDVSDEDWNLLIDYSYQHVDD